MASDASESLRRAVEGSPDLPGVYSFLDQRGRVLYIGKAKSLRKRLKGHLSAAGDTRHSRVPDKGCDLLVIGGYAHSRLRDLVVGGVTETMLEHMTVPVLMSH